MKKLLAVLFALTLVSSTVYAAENVKPDKPEMKPMYNCPNHRQDRINRAAAFDKRLGLTSEQKSQAKELRKEGFEKMKPVFEEMKAKRIEEKSIRESNLTAQAQKEKLAEINKELKALEKKAGEIRRENMKEFESILTKEQKETLKQMKKEGRENFKKAHPKGPHPILLPPEKPIKVDK